MKWTLGETRISDRITVEIQIVATSTIEPVELSAIGCMLQAMARAIDIWRASEAASSQAAPSGAAR